MCTGQDCKEEFNCQAFGLEYEKPKHFGLAQCGQKSILYVIYRWIFSLFFIVSFIYDWATYDNGPWWKFLIFLTHWGFFWLAITTLAGALVATHVYLRDSNELDYNSSMPILYKIYWVLHNVNLDVAPIVTAIYWLAVYDPDIHDITYANIVFHAVNSVYVLIDFSYSSVPVRILHFIYGFTFGVVYLVFTIIYWQADGTNEQGEPFIYSIIDYENDAETAVIWIVALFAMVIVIHIVWFGLYKLRVHIYSSCGCAQDKSIKPTTHSPNTANSPM